jgi:hypothetical protein
LPLSDKVDYLTAVVMLCLAAEINDLLMVGNKAGKYPAL